MKKITIFTLFVICTTISYAQQNKTDSLFSILKTEKNDSVKILLLKNIGQNYQINFKLDSALYFYDKAIKICENIADTVNVKDIYYKKASVYFSKSQKTEKQTNLIWIIAISLIITFLLIILLIIQISITKNKNKQLTAKDKYIINHKKEIAQRKEEISEMTDILKTANKTFDQNYKKLKESEKYLSRIFKTANEAIWIVDNNSKTLDANDKLCEILLQKKENLIGKSIYEFVDKENKKIFVEQAILRRQGKFGKYEIQIQNKLGENIYCIFSVSPLYDNDDKMSGSFAMITDISKQKNNEQKLQRLNSRLKNILKETRKQKEIIEEKNTYVHDSINYAKRIQQAVLPDNETINGIISNNFIIYKPKDIVSGDFYWIKKINSHIVVVAGDSTGHGVPGAFISMLGISFLSDYFLKNNILTPGSVLDSFRKKVKTSLNQINFLDSHADGIDISLCIINTETLELEYAGAYNSIYIIANNIDKKITNGRMSASEGNRKIRVMTLPKNENPESENLQIEKYMLEIRSDRQPIGIHLREKPFATQKIQLYENDFICLFSDGFSDQLNEKKTGRFGVDRFRKLLFSVSTKHPLTQKYVVEEAFRKWKGKSNQIDDVLVLGIKIKDL